MYKWILSFMVDNKDNQTKMGGGCLKSNENIRYGI